MRKIFSDEKTQIHPKIKAKTTSEKTTLSEEKRSFDAGVSSHARV